MNCFQLSFNLIFICISLRSCINLSDGLKWISKPSNETFGHVGSTVHINWHYDCNQTFVVSTIIYDNRQMVQRSSPTRKYIPIKSNMDAHFSVIGGSNVTIIMSDVDKDKSGSYCCEVTCIGLSSEKKCTMLFIYALPRINYLTSHLYGKQGDSITLRCNASGHPAPNYTWIHNDKNRKIANSCVTSFNITGKESGGKYCCHVSNRFGEENNCTSLEVIEPPTIVDHPDNRITMRNDSITLQCKATGTPRPNITWYDKLKNTTVEAANGTLLVQNEDCKNSTSQYYCVASNVVADVKSPSITVEAFQRNSVSSCKKNGSKNNDESILHSGPDWLLIIIVVVCPLLTVALILAFILFSRKRKKSKRDMDKGAQSVAHDLRQNQSMEESPYGEPVDAIRVRSVIHTSASNVDYATVEETGYKPVITSKTVQQPPRDETFSSKKVKSNVEPVYAIVNKNKKKDKSADVPLNSLNDEKPADFPIQNIL